MAFQGDSIFWVEVDKIVPNPYQPRREFDEAKLKELAESVRMYGILQPLTVTRKEIQRDDGAFFTEYELIAGERRLRASKIAGLQQVPVIIREKEDTEQEKLELAIIENLQREDLNAVDRALAFQQLANAFDLTHDQVAKKVGRSRMYVSNTIRLLGLPEYMLDSLKVGDISEGHARTLLMLKDKPEEQDVVFREILLKKLSVREVERIVRKIATDKVRKKNWKGTDPHLIEIEKEFTDALGTRVQIAKTDYGGKLTIDYFSEDDLQKLLTVMRRQEEDKAKAEAEKSGSSPVVQTMAAVSASTPLESADEELPQDSLSDHNLEDSFTNQPEESKEESSPEESEDASSEQAAVEETTSSRPEQEDVPVQEEQPVSEESKTTEGDAQANIAEEKNAADSSHDDPFAEVLGKIDDEITEIEKHVLESAHQAAGAADRPSPEDRVESSAAAREEVNNQISSLAERESVYTPVPKPIEREGEVVEKPEQQTGESVDKEVRSEDKKDEDDDDSNLYSRRNFSI